MKLEGVKVLDLSMFLPGPHLMLHLLRQRQQPLRIDVKGLALWRHAHRLASASQERTTQLSLQLFDAVGHCRLGQPHPLSRGVEIA